MKASKIFIVMGNPMRDSFSAALADSYEHAAQRAEHEVRRVNISELSYDPILHQGYRVRQELEADLLKVQEHITWCDHFVLVYPMWWSAMPALLKGMFDRMLMPGFAFKMKKREHWYSLPGWHKLLTGRTMRIIVTSKSAPWITRTIIGDATETLAKNMFGFSGLRYRITRIGDAENMSDRTRAYWLRYTSKLAERAK